MESDTLIFNWDVCEPLGKGTHMHVSRIFLPRYSGVIAGCRGLKRAARRGGNERVI